MLAPAEARPKLDMPRQIMPMPAGPDDHPVAHHRHAAGHRLFEGKAQAASTSNKLSYLVPNLIEAMFTNFPGDSGKTVRITVAPEKPATGK